MSCLFHQTRTSSIFTWSVMSNDLDTITRDEFFRVFVRVWEESNRWDVVQCRWWNLRDRFAGRATRDFWRHHAGMSLEHVRVMMKIYCDLEMFDLWSDLQGRLCETFLLRSFMRKMYYDRDSSKREDERISIPEADQKELRCRGRYTIHERRGKQRQNRSGSQ